MAQSVYVPCTLWAMTISAPTESMGVATRGAVAEDTHMRRLLSGPERELERFVLCTKRIILGCRCGKKLVLLSLEGDWFVERASFECECGRRLTLADCVEEEVPPSLGQLLRGLA